MIIEEEKDGSYRVTGHEGRHRANALLQLGYTHVPVEVRASDIRWSEQNNPDNFDYKQNWPTKLISQDGKRSVPFPVSREESSKEARVSEAKKEPAVQLDEGEASPEPSLNINQSAESNASELDKLADYFEDLGQDAFSDSIS